MDETNRWTQPEAESSKKCTRSSDKIPLYKYNSCNASDTSYMCSSGMSKVMEVVSKLEDETVNSTELFKPYSETGSTKGVVHTPTLPRNSKNLCINSDEMDHCINDDNAFSNLYMRMGKMEENTCKGKQKKEHIGSGDEKEEDEILYNMASMKLTGTSIMLTNEKSRYIYKVIPFFKNGEAKFYIKAFEAYSALYGRDCIRACAPIPTRCALGHAHEEVVDPHDNNCDTEKSGKGTVIPGHRQNSVLLSGNITHEATHDAVCDTTHVSIHDEINDNIRDIDDVPSIEYNKVHGGPVMPLQNDHTFRPMGNGLLEGNNTKACRGLVQMEANTKRLTINMKESPSKVHMEDNTCKEKLQNWDFQNGKQNMHEHDKDPVATKSEYPNKTNDKCASNEKYTLSFLVKHKLIPRCYSIVSVYRCRGNGQKVEGEVGEIPQSAPDIESKRDKKMTIRDDETWRVGRCVEEEKSSAEHGSFMALKLKKVCSKISPENQHILDLKLGYYSLRNNDKKFNKELLKESEMIDWYEKERCVKKWSEMKKKMRKENLDMSDKHITYITPEDLNLPYSFHKYNSKDIYCLLKSWKQEITSLKTTQRTLGFRICALIYYTKCVNMLKDEYINEFYQNHILNNEVVYLHELTQEERKKIYSKREKVTLKDCYDSEKKRLRIGRDIGLNLSEAQVLYFLVLFLKKIVHIVLPKLMNLKMWLEEQTVYSFCSTSLLIIYDKKNTSFCDVKWIDFTYSFENEHCVEEKMGKQKRKLNADILFGINNLIKLCKTVFSNVSIPPAVSLLSRGEGDHQLAVD
ncbi:kinase, putative [Plasmodium ovale]|uniref:Kinase n=1 Tax=Plasmodium ovale TaxID=36330 RepID=A0A1D3U8P3_PLAOA|nr:kinase, putative [Plasmodium ovale]